MLELVKLDLEKTKPVAHDIFLSFKDNSISTEQYVFLKDRLENFILTLNPEYGFNYQTTLDESSDTLLIGLIITSPDRLIPQDSQKVTEIVVDLIKEFVKFYENEKNQMQ